MTRPSHRPADSSDLRAAVLHVTPFDSLSGANRAMLTLIDGLRAEGTLVSEVFALADSPVTAEAASRGIAVRVARHGRTPNSGRIGRAGDWVAVTLALWRAIRASGASLVHSHSARAMRYCAPAAALAGVPVVCHQRDNYAPDRFHAGLGRARHLIAVSDQVRNTLPPTLAGRTTTVRDAVEVPDAPPPLGSGGPVRIGAAGRCVPEKGFDLLLDAAERLGESTPARPAGGPDWAVEVWGVPAAGSVWDDAAARALRDRADALPASVRGRVTLRPFADDVGAFYAGVDVVVVPSRFAEPLGLVAREAMARRRAVVVAAHGGLVESVEDGRTGLTFPPGDAAGLAEALRRLIDRPNLRRRLADAGLAEARARFTPAVQAVAVRRIYADVFGL